MFLEKLSLEGLVVNITKSWCKYHLSDVAGKYTVQWAGRQWYQNTRLRKSDVGSRFRQFHVVNHESINVIFFVLLTLSRGKWASSVNKLLGITRRLLLFKLQHCGRLPLITRSRCWTRWIWLECYPSPYMKFSRLMSRTLRRTETLLVLQRGLRCSMSITFSFSSTLRCTWGLARRSTLGKEPFPPRCWWTRVNPCRPGIRRRGYQCRYSSSASVASSLRNPYQNAQWRTFRGKASCMLLLLTAHLTTARTDCAVCYLRYCRPCYDYMSTPTPGHISHASTAANSATAAIRNHVYDISGSELPLELNPAVLPLSSGNIPIFSYEEPITYVHIPLYVKLWT